MNPASDMMLLARGLLSALMLCLFVGVAAAQDGGSSASVFKVDRLNAGLGPAGDINRDTPQAAVETFLYLTRGGDYENAAHLLDLDRFEPSSQAEIGSLLARQLQEVIDRKVWIDWNALPDRPDGLNPVPSSNDPMRGQPRRSLRLELIDMGGRPVPIRLARIKPGDGDPVWVFSAQTVENVPALHSLYGPRAFERMLPDWAKQSVFMGLAAWELVALPLLLLAALVVGLLTHRATSAIIDRLEKDRLPGRIVSTLAVPVAVIAAGLVIYFATKAIFVFSVAIDAFMTPAILLLLFGSALMIMVRIIDFVIEKTLENDVAELEKPENADARAFQTNLSAFRRVAIVVVLLFFVGAILTQINFLATTGIALVGSAGVVTLILAFAGRSALSNVMASLQIAMSKTATIGDSVLFEDQWAHVEKINFTYVQLKTWDNRRLIVPVTHFVSEPFENWTKRDPTITKLVTLRLNHMANVDALRERFDDFVQENDKVIDKESAALLVVGHDATGMEVGFYASATDPSTGWEMHCELREKMLEAAAELENEATDGRRYMPTEREVLLEKPEQKDQPDD